MTKTQLIVVSFILVLLILPAVYASKGFALSSSEGSKTICIGSTDVVISTITGSAGRYVAESSGKAAIFSTTVPTEFILDEGRIQNIYSYLTIPSTASEGIYDLEIKVTAFNSTKVQTHKIIVKNCHGTSLINDGDRRICPCEQAKYKLLLENSGEFNEKFNIYIDGTAMAWANLSTTKIELGPGKSTEFYVTINPPCQIHGTYTLDIKAIGYQSLARAITKAKLEIMPCYEYTLSAEKKYDICENEIIDIPIKVNNTGTANNSFSFIISKGADWIKLKSKSLQLKSNSEGLISLIASPPFRTEGSFPVKIEAMSSGGAVKKTIETNINVRKCYDAAVKVETEYDRFCGKQKEYTIIIKNKGEFKSTYNLSIEGPGWVELNKNFVDIGARSNATVKLTAQPPARLKSGKYSVKITATDIESKNSYSDSMEIEIFPPEECYKAELITNRDKIGVELEKAETIFIMLKNEGISSATYIVDISGSGGKFSMINPKIATIAPNKSETLFLYVSPSLFTKSDKYLVNVTARVKDTNIITSKEISINVLETGHELNESTEHKEIKGNFLTETINSIKNFFKRMFMVQPTKKTAEILANLSDENTAFEEQISKMLGKPNESEDKNPAAIGNKTAEEAVKETLESAKKESKTEISAADNITTNAGENENEAAEDTALQEKANDLKAKAIQIDDFMTKYQYYFIAAGVIALIAITIITGFWKKIVEFFEEEVPEKKRN